jgi:hypothetical protein
VILIIGILALKLKLALAAPIVGRHPMQAQRTRPNGAFFHVLLE